jgi:hypothetical protein
VFGRTEWREKEEKPAFRTRHATVQSQEDKLLACQCLTPRNTDVGSASARIEPKQSR